MQTGDVQYFCCRCSLMWYKQVVKHSAFIKTRCEPELVERVDALAKHWKVRSSDIVRIALESYLSERAGTANPMIAPPLRGPATAPRPVNSPGAAEEGRLTVHQAAAAKIAEAMSSVRPPAPAA